MYTLNMKGHLSDSETFFSSCRTIAFKDGSSAQLTWLPMMMLYKTERLVVKKQKLLKRIKISVGLV